MKRLLVGGIVGALLTGAVVHVSVSHYAGVYRSSCWASLLADSEKVHTERWDRSDVLGAELNGYTAVHWQVEPPTSGLRHVPQPDQCAYQLVLDLKPAQARRLAADIATAEAAHQQRFTAAKSRSFLARRAAAEARFPGRSLPWHPRPTVWPALKRFVPVEGRWESWGGCCPYDGHRGRVLHVHADSAVAVVTFTGD